MPNQDQDPMQELQRSLARLHQLSTMIKTVSQQAEGRDPSGAVTVIMDADQRLTSITVATKWQEKVEPEALAAAVQAAISDAMVQSFGGPGQAEPGLQEPPEPSEEDRRRARAMISEQTDFFSRAAQRSEGELMEKLHGAMARFNQLSSELQPRQDGPAEYFNASRRASIVYQAGFPVEVRLDRNWVKSLSGMSLTAAFAEILEQAAGERNQLHLGLDRTINLGL
ncbi:hypothetical protein HJ590_17715 [Naumannella sp. ID2617S]|nr:hypothetical protein [Naumannella sp. ID2617S]